MQIQPLNSADKAWLLPVMAECCTVLTVPLLDDIKQKYSLLSERLSGSPGLGLPGKHADVTEHRQICHMYLVDKGSCQHAAVGLHH